MDDILVHVCRTIACYPRLKILALLANKPEISPTELARELKMPLPKISDHLRRLSAAGLIQRRPSGVRCYCVAKSPYGETALSGKLSRWLFRVLREHSSDKSSSSAKRNGTSRPAESTPELIFNAATAFTHLRRVQILRHLQARGEGDSETMTTKLKMSLPALSRHCAKLARRGVLVSEETADGWKCRLGDRPKTPIHQEMFEMIRSVLAKP
jgi:DNA-binding MarR family transcriptional regulator